MMNNIKQVEKIYADAQPHMVGDGFRVFNAFPNGSGLPLNRLSPFFLLDYAAPHYFAPARIPRGVDAHPHRGFETVTIAYQGAVSHRDSGGSSGIIHEGDIQWMTAASGVVHEEKHENNFTQNGGTFEMIQLWVNLPKAHKMDKPRYQTLLKENIPVITLSENGSYLRVIAGKYENISGPAQTFSPINMYDVLLKKEDEISLALPEDFTTAIYVREGGKLRINNTHTAAGKNLIVMENKGETITLKALEDVAFVVLNGEPLHESIVAYGPFVMNTKEEISQAINDYQEGKMGRLN